MVISTHNKKKKKKTVKSLEPKFSKFLLLVKTRVTLLLTVILVTVFELF